MDSMCPVPTAYGACPNTESANQLAGAVSAIGSDSSAGAVIGRRRWISVVHSWFRVRLESRWRRDGRRWAWRYLDGGIDEDLALLLAVRSQHDGIDWDRFAGPGAQGQYDGIDWDCARDQGERVP